MESSKDYTDYLFKGNIHRKGRLVLAIVKKYVEDNPKTTYKMLKTIFPDKLQSTTNIQFSSTQLVISTIDEIKPKDIKRFFLKPDEILRTDDGEVAISREWNYENIQVFIQAAKALGYDVQPIISSP